MSEHVSQEEVTQAANAIRRLTKYRPQVGLILGSGLGDLAESVQQPDIIPTAELPHWPHSTVPGHVGRLVIGRIEGKVVLVLQGRTHFYEGYSMGRVTLPVRVMHALGVNTLIVTNAAGGLNANYRPGDLMVIRDHLNFPGMAGNNPLRGPNDESIGPRFPDMTMPYDSGLRALAHEIARQEGFALREGVYAYVGGPSFETPAELRFLQFAGGDAVGMSTASEVVTARHAGLRVLGISSIANMALPDPTPGTTLTHEEVLQMGAEAIPRLIAIVRGVIRLLEDAG